MAVHASDETSPPPLALTAPRVGRPRHLTAFVAAGLVAAASLVPLVFVIRVTAEVGFDVAWSLIVRPRVGDLLINTFLLEATTIPLAIALAVALAWLTERTDLPGARLWAWLAVAPLAIPAFVQSYAWIGLMPGMKGLWSAVLVSVLAYYPFIYLPVAATLRRLDPAVEDAAAALGLSPVAVFFRVVVPQLRLAITGGALLVGLHLLSEYGLFVTIRFDTFATAIIDQFQSAYDGPAANMLGGVLIVLCLGLIGLEALARGGERYARVGSGAPRPSRPRRLGLWCLPALGLTLATTLLALGVPMATLGRWLAIGGLAAWPLDEIVSAVAQTVFLAFAGGVLTVATALPMAWLSVRAPSQLTRALEACHYYVGSLPGVVVALALVGITLRSVPVLYQTLATLFVAYILLFQPRAMVALRASVAQAPIELERAAEALGRTPIQAIVGITLRLAAPGAAAGAALVGLGITNELTATLMLAPNGVSTLATRFWSLTSEIDYVAAAPYALMMIVLSLPLTHLLHSQSQRSAGR